MVQRFIGRASGRKDCYDRGEKTQGNLNYVCMGIVEERGPSNAAELR